MFPNINLPFVKRHSPEKASYLVLEKKQQEYDGEIDPR